MLLQAFLPGKVSDSTILKRYSQTTPLFSQMHALQLLMHLRCSFLGHSYDLIDSSAAKNSG